METHFDMCYWCSTKEYISLISVHNLPKLPTLNVDISYERKLLYAKKARNRWYPAETLRDADYAEDIALLPNTPTQAESLQPNLQQVAGGIGLHVNAYKTDYVF